MKKVVMDDLAGYIHKSPYPPRKVISCNEYYAEILMDDYAGDDSESTAIAQYTYHRNVNIAEEEELRYHFLKLCEVERLHRDILAELIVKLGTYPVYRAGNMSDIGYWHGLHVNYGRSILEQLRLDLELEYRAIKNYNTHIRLISDPYIKAVLARIVLDEEVHVDWLQRLIEQYC